MKKLFITAALAAALSSTNALAKTEGNYLGLDLTRTSAESQYFIGSNTRIANYSAFSDSAYGLGATYQYAFNLNNFFIAPGLYYNSAGTKAADKDRDTVSINSIYGAKLSFGYDINDQFSVYVPITISRVNYKVDWKSVEMKKSGNANTSSIGLGFAYSPIEKVSLSLEYNRYAKTDLKTPDAGTGAWNAKTQIDVLKFGVAYKF